jgi:hypothetical protein
MFLVIIGAGASYDSVPAHPPTDLVVREFRPPLANQLFEDRPVFRAAMTSFPQCSRIIPYLMSSNANVEKVLEQLQQEGEKDEERLRQLSAIRYYLHTMFWALESGWKAVEGGISNYRTLLDQLRRTAPLDGVCIATFNYDTMIEDAFPVGQAINNLSDYVSSDRLFKLIKLHGSKHWARRVALALPDQLQRMGSWQVAQHLINQASNVRNAIVPNDYRIVTSIPMGVDDDAVLYPAIAIPVETKRDYECPESHLSVLRASLPKVDKIVTIGWRGAETAFVTEVAIAVGRRAPVMVVAGSEHAATEVSDRLEAANLGRDFVRHKAGFTQAIVQRDIEQFLSA